MNNPTDKQYWLTLSERYFDAETTDEEERLLRQFAAQTDDPDFDALRATMGYTAVGRHFHQAPQAQAHPVVPLWRYAGIAAGVLLMVMLSFHWLNPSPQQPECIAYEHGQRIDEPDRVMALMQGTLQACAQAGVDDPVEAQLREMFEL